MNPKHKNNPPTVQQHHQKLNDVDGDCTVLFARILKKTGMVSTKNNFNRAPKHPNTRCTTTEEFFSDPQYTTTPGSGLPAHPDPRLPVPQNFQHTHTQSFDVLDRYVEQIHLRKEWEEKMEKLNEKYGLDYFSDSELDSELDERENYRYEHKYETLT